MNPLPAPAVLLVEDDVDTASLIREVLIDHFRTDRVTHVERIADLASLDLSSFDIVLSDLNLPDGSGLDLIGRLLSRRADLPIVLVTSESALDAARQAIHNGAYDYVVKTGDFLLTIPLIVEKNLAVWRMKRDNVRLQQELTRTLDALRQKNELLEDAVRKLAEQAATDPLTELANRRHVQEVLERSFAETVRYGSDLACLMIDLDGFKQLNDQLGHQMGDRLLQTTARVLAANCRRCDLAGRYGGDEFVVLLTQTSPAMARQVAERIQNQFDAAVCALVSACGEGLSIGMSVGIACVSLSRPVSADHLVAMADTALYVAKQSGKGRVVIHQAAASDSARPLRNGPTQHIAT